jgi:hypothetical protein
MPELKRRPACDVTEIAISRQHYQITTDAKPGKQSVNSSNLNAMPATLVAQTGCFYVILTAGLQQWERLEMLDNPNPGPRSTTTLQ